MTPSEAPLYTVGMAVGQATHRFSVDDYERMIEAGLFTEAGRIELIDGEIVEMTPIGLRHEAVTDRLTRLFTDALGHRAIVKIQGSVVINDRSQPQPDVSILAARDDFYATRRPRPDDIELLVEVSDSSLTYDRNVKMPRYATAGVREAWVVDLVSDAVYVSSDPGPGGYATVWTARRGDTVAPASWPDAVLPVDDILGPLAATGVAPE